MAAMPQGLVSNQDANKAIVQASFDRWRSGTGGPFELLTPEAEWTIVGSSPCRHPAYDALMNKVMGIITDPKQMATYSSPEQIAEVVYEAATDGKDQLRYVAGEDAKSIYATRLQLGDEAFRKAMAKQFLGDAAKVA